MTGKKRGNPFVGSRRESKNIKAAEKSVRAELAAAAVDCADMSRLRRLLDMLEKIRGDYSLPDANYDVAGYAMAGGGVGLGVRPQRLRDLGRGILDEEQMDFIQKALVAQATSANPWQRQARDLLDLHKHFLAIDPTLAKKLETEAVRVLTAGLEGDNASLHPELLGRHPTQERKHDENEDEPR